MSKIALELENCKGCPHHLNTPYVTDDSWERAEYYWCKCPDIKEEVEGRTPEDEEHRLSIKKYSKNIEKLSYVDGYVEWMDKVPIPDSCPIKIKE